MGHLIGFVYLLIGAVCGGSFGLPSKYAKKETPWEVLWGPFFFFVTIVLPLAVGPVLANDFFAVYGAAGWGALIAPLIFGLLWGLGSMTLGMSFAFIGLSLAYSLNYGAQIITGSIVPMAIHHQGDFATTHGAVILGGVAICIVGVVVAGKAAILKERSMKAEASPEELPAEDMVVPEAPGEDQAAEAPPKAKSPAMLIGVIVAVVSGVLCACYAIAFGFVGKLGKVAALPEYGFNNGGVQTAWIQVCIIVWGGAISACTYCIVQLFRHKTWSHFRKPGIGLTLVLALAMALLHDAAIFFANLGFGKLEKGLGVAAGYPAFMSFAIIVGNLHGFRTGEWKGASKKSIQLIVTGIVILIVGVVILAQGNWMAEKARDVAKPSSPPAATQPAK